MGSKGEIVDISHLRDWLGPIVISLLSTGSLWGQQLEEGPSRWETEIRALELRDQQHPPAQEGVLFYGSSSIHLWNLKKSFPNLAAVNHGFGGAEINDCIRYAPRMVLTIRPRVVVFYAGDNDIAGGKSARQVHADFLRFVGDVRAVLPTVRIVFIAIKPSLARWKFADKMREANARIAHSCEQEESLVFVDAWEPMLGDDDRPSTRWFLEDGLHLNEKGYQLWTTLTCPHLEVPK